MKMQAPIGLRKSCKPHCGFVHSHTKAVNVQICDVIKADWCLSASDLLIHLEVVHMRAWGGYSCNLTTIHGGKDGKHIFPLLSVFRLLALLGNVAFIPRISAQTLGRTTSFWRQERSAASMNACARVLGEKLTWTNNPQTGKASRLHRQMVSLLSTRNILESFLRYICQTMSCAKVFYIWSVGSFESMPLRGKDTPSAVQLALSLLEARGVWSVLLEKAVIPTILVEPMGWIICECLYVYINENS